MGRNSHIPTADTEQYILEKVCDVFNKKGYWGTSLSDLEKASGLTKGSIYANFRDKEEVALKVFEFNYQHMRQALQQRVSGKAAAKEKLLAHIEFYLDYYPTMKTKGGCALQNALVEADDTNPALFERARQALASWKDSVQRILEEGVQNREFGPGLDAGQYAAYLLASIEGAILVAKSLDSQTIFADILGHVKSEISRL
ncbi:TetR/AcrR family transcriptional regulator [Paraflavisolibacter sp. H34]|uniref:TetR/AcrR family transcriptional regulator n=1 Tax=Huijunlia imazamoxiresistens TaxID=3127457 RepID=UPI00301927D5